MSTLLKTRKRRAEQTLWTRLDQHLLPVAHQGVVLAISGGPDSRALLESIASWPHRKHGRFLVVSLDHGQRHEAQEESRYVYMRAKRLGFKAHHENIALKKSSEKDLRELRYRALCRIAKENSCAALCLAHHRDDDAEGYFMALMGVGGGELGAAMSEISKLDSLKVVRPFLTLEKKDLLLNLTLKEQTDFVRDRLDESSKGQRALVRNIIFPELLKKAPGLKTRLASFGRHQSQQNKILEKLGLEAVSWQDKKTAKLQVDLDKSIIISALWQILKRWSDGRDLRACKHTIDRIVGDLGDSCLDPSSNAFNLKGLSVKKYQFPGVVVFKGPKDMVAKRIDPV